MNKRTPIVLAAILLGVTSGGVARQKGSERPPIWWKR